MKVGSDKRNKCYLCDLGDNKMCHFSLVYHQFLLCKYPYPSYPNLHMFICHPRSLAQIYQNEIV